MRKTNNAQTKKAELVRCRPSSPRPAARPCRQIWLWPALRHTRLAPAWLGIVTPTVARAYPESSDLVLISYLANAQDAAKAAVSAQARAKKDIKLGREPKADKPKPGAEGAERKRVSFA